MTTRAYWKCSYGSVIGSVGFAIMRLRVMQGATYGLNDICAEHYNPLLMIVCMIFISPFCLRSCLGSNSRLKSSTRVFAVVGFLLAISVIIK